MSLARDNHYVPRAYLKRWESAPGRAWTYRLLVSHHAVPEWKQVSTRGIAYHEHLYTRVAAAGESDEIEHWLDREFEAPAQEAIERATTDRPLRPSDWRALARFFGAQDVRTPARLLENLKRWSEQLPAMIQEQLHETVARLERREVQKDRPSEANPAMGDPLPFRVSIQKDPERGGGWIKAETVAGRGLWLWSIRHLLSSAVNVLHSHRWTILVPPDGMKWLTTDDPVLRLNFNSLTDYHFEGGWGNPGTDLILPLGPRHLLYTQVQRPVPPRGEALSPAVSGARPRDLDPAWREPRPDRRAQSCPRVGLLRGRDPALTTAERAPTRGQSGAGRL